MDGRGRREGAPGQGWGWWGQAAGSLASHSPSHTRMKTDGAVVTYSYYPPGVLEKVSYFEYGILTVFLGFLTALSQLYECTGLV